VTYSVNNKVTMSMHNYQYSCKSSTRVINIGPSSHNGQHYEQKVRTKTNTEVPWSGCDRAGH